MRYFREMLAWRISLVGGRLNSQRNTNRRDNIVRISECSELATSTTSSGAIVPEQTNQTDLNHVDIDESTARFINN